MIYRVALIFSLMTSQHIFAKESEKFYRKLNQQFIRTINLKNTKNEKIIYGHPEIGFFKANNIIYTKNHTQVTYIPPSYQLPTYFYQKNHKGIYQIIHKETTNSPLPKAFNLIKTKVSGKFSAPFYLLGGALPRSRFYNPDNPTLKADQPFKNKTRFCFSMVVNKLGEIIAVYVPIDNKGNAFNGYPVVEPLGSGEYGLLLGKRESTFIVYDYKGRSKHFVDIANRKNRYPIHHDFIAYNGESFASLGYRTNNFGSEKTFIITTIMRTYIKDRRPKILKDFSTDFNPFETKWQEESEKRSYFTSWGQDNADHDFTHGNGLRDTPWGYLISFRHLSQIALLRKKNLKKIWSVGSSADNDFIASGKARFDFQHSPIIDKNKNLILFDNGFSQKRSRILALRLKGKKAHFVWQFPKKSPYFSKDRGSIVAVNNGNLLAYFVSPNVIGEQEKPTTRSDYLIEFNPENQEELGKMQVIFFTKSPGYRAIPLDSINTDNYLKSLPSP